MHRQAAGDCSLAATQTKRTAVSDLCHCATGAGGALGTLSCYINRLLLLFLDCRRRHVGRGMGLPKQTVYWRIRRFTATCCVNRLFTYLLNGLPQCSAGEPKLDGTGQISGRTMRQTVWKHNIIPYCMPCCAYPGDIITNYIPTRTGATDEVASYEWCYALSAFSCANQKWQWWEVKRLKLCENQSWFKSNCDLDLAITGFLCIIPGYIFLMNLLISIFIYYYYWSVGKKTACLTNSFFLYFYIRQRRRYMFLPVFVCLSVC